METTDSDAIDPQALERLRRIGGDALLSNIVALFTSHAEPALREAASGLELGNFDSVQRIAHALKSSAGNIGAQQVQHLAGRIEQLAEIREARQIQPLLTDLRTAYLRAKARLAKEVDEGRAPLS
jgi:HPt (histidine-containing phosphotransfer) domain-containing protein